MISDVAKTYIGVPFRHQGRNPRQGLDCAGVLVCALESMGQPVSDRRRYDRVPPRDLLQATVERHGFVRRLGPPRTDDVCLFWMRHPRLVIHCGIAADDGRNLIHVEDGRRVESVPLRIWQPQLAAVYSLPGGRSWRS